MRTAIVVETDVGDFDPHLVGRRAAVAAPSASRAQRQHPDKRGRRNRNGCSVAAPHEA
jgi:hypothetical protein